MVSLIVLSLTVLAPGASAQTTAAQTSGDYDDLGTKFKGQDNAAALLKYPLFITKIHHFTHGLIRLYGSIMIR
jgi:hypothetical protein